MAIVNTKSTVITNRDSTPKVLVGDDVSGGSLRQGQGFVPVATTDSIGSIYRMTQVPSNCRVARVDLSNAALTACVVNIGVYYPTFIPIGPANVPGSLTAALSATAINATFFASALSLATAAQDTNITNQSGTNTIALQEQPLWMALGLSADPGIWFDICAISTTAATAAGNFSVKASFVA